MRTIVQFGAGCIGRGFLGQLWNEAGYETVFVEVRDELIDGLNTRHAYPLHLTDGKTSEVRTIAPVRALHADDIEAVASALATCDFAATAVGAKVIPDLAPALAEGLRRRGDSPLRVLCCENGVGVSESLHRAVTEALGAEPTNFSAVAVSVGRMVPHPSPDLLASDPLAILAEPFGHLIARASDWPEPHPTVPVLTFAEDFERYELRKLYLHNGGHALLAYAGYLRGHTYIHEAAEDPEIADDLRGFWHEVGEALARACGFDRAALTAYEDELYTRFLNPVLADTITRVGGNPIRKLQKNDRLVGAGLLCAAQGIESVYVARAIAYALCFDAPGDASAVRLQSMVQSVGVRATLTELTGLPADTPLFALCEKACAAHTGINARRAVS